MEDSKSNELTMEYKTTNPAYFQTQSIQILSKHSESKSQEPKADKLQVDSACVLIISDSMGTLVKQNKESVTQEINS